MKFVNALDFYFYKLLIRDFFNLAMSLFHHGWNFHKWNDISNISKILNYCLFYSLYQIDRLCKIRLKKTVSITILYVALQHYLWNGTVKKNFIFKKSHLNLISLSLFSCVRQLIKIFLFNFFFKLRLMKFISHGIETFFLLKLFC